MPQIQTLSKNQQVVFDIILKAKEPLKAYSILYNVQKKGINAPQQIYRALDKLIEIENTIFPPYLIFQFHNIGFPSILEKMIAWSYINLTIVFALTFVIVYIFRQYDIRRLIITTALIPLLLFPFWVMFPATSPEGFMVKNIFNQELNPEIQNEIENINRSPYVDKKIEKLNTIWIDENNNYLNVSSIPSLHAALGLILAYFAIRAKSITGLFYIPWFIFNAIGTFFLFQHFILDAILGIIAGSILIFLLNRYYFED